MSARYTLNLCHLYPELMNLYGDRGNMIALQRRCQWHGITARVMGLGPGQELDPAEYDIIFIGGGQDKEQRAIAPDLVEVKGPSLIKAVEQGVVLLAVCGGYQLLGHYYRPVEGEILPGLGLLDIRTEGGRRRLIGNVVIESDLDSDGPRTIVGFENHSGRTFLGPGVRPLGRVISGWGNNGEDRTEGAVYRNAIGTYLHGSLLPKNPWLADWLVARALERRYGTALLDSLDDSMEERAHAAAINRAISRP